MSSDAETLRNAMKGFGTDEATLIKVVANRTTSQRQAIKEQYKAAFGRDLIADLKSELNGKMEDAFIALFTNPVEFDADSLRAAMSGAGTNEDTLIEIIASRNNQQLAAIKQCYNAKYKRDLEADIKSEVHGTLEHLLEIFDAGEGKLGTDESTFNKYFVSLSPMELACVAQHYHKISGHTILDAIDKEFHGDSKKAFRTIVYATLSPSEYFATRVKDAIKGFGTKDTLLIRILVSRDEIDMPQIKQYYKQLYGKDMIEDIKSDIHGDYEKLLVELCSH